MPRRGARSGAVVQQLAEAFEGLVAGGEAVDLGVVARSGEGGELLAGADAAGPEVALQEADQLVGWDGPVHAAAAGDGLDGAALAQGLEGAVDAGRVLAELLGDLVAGGGAGRGEGQELEVGVGLGAGEAEVGEGGGGVFYISVVVNT